MATVSVTLTQAGRYIAQPAGHRAFMPAPPPPLEPLLASGGERQGFLPATDRALGRLDESVFTEPDPDLFVLRCTCASRK